MAERDVIVRLKVRREDSAAFRDVSKQAKETAQAIERIPKAVQAAGHAAAGGGAGALGGALTRGGIGAAIAYGAVGTLEGWSRASAIARNDRLTRGEKFQGIAENAIPILGEMGVRAGRAAREIFTGENFYQGRQLEALRNQGITDSIMHGARRQNEDFTRSLFGTSSASAQNDVNRAARSLAEMNKAVHDAAASHVVTTVTIAKYGEALSKQRMALEDFGDAVKRSGLAMGGRLAAAKDFASLPASERRAAAHAFNYAQTMGYGNLDPAFKKDLSHPIFDAYHDREKTKLALNDPLTIDMSNMIVNMTGDSPELNRELARKLGLEVETAILAKLNENAKKIAQNQVQQDMARQALQQRAQQSNVP